MPRVINKPSAFTKFKKNYLERRSSIIQFDEESVTNTCVYTLDLRSVLLQFLLASTSFDHSLPPNFQPARPAQVEKQFRVDWCRRERRNRPRRIFRNDRWPKNAIFRRAIPIYRQRQKWQHKLRRIYSSRVNILHGMCICIHFIRCTNIRCTNSTARTTSSNFASIW